MVRNPVSWCCTAAWATRFAVQQQGLLWCLRRAGMNSLLWLAQKCDPDAIEHLRAAVRQQVIKDYLIQAMDERKATDGE